MLNHASRAAQFSRWANMVVHAAAVLACLARMPASAQTPTCINPPPGSALWSNPGSWPSGLLPTAGSCVSIPAGTTMYLDVAVTPALAELEIQGTLIVPCGTHTLQARNILVTGSLQAGTQAAPYSGQLTIRLLAGSLCTPGKEEQTLAVEGNGVLQLAGIPYGPSWTRLRTTAPATSSVPTQILDLTSTVPWVNGQEVVIASTDFDQNQAERKTVYSNAGNSIKVTGGLANTHWGDTEGLSFDPIGIDERAEVGLLTRSIVIEGTPYTLPGGGISGGHVIVRKPLGLGTLTELSWVQFKNLGKEGVLGKYPMHFHELGNAPGSFVRYCSFDKSYNRAVAIHSTNSVDVSYNVAYDVIGHAYYFEDNQAQNCTMVGNLGLLTHAGTILASDANPSTFWLHSPNNVVVGNAAAGSSAYGFWIDTDSGDTSPWGPGQFVDNVAHSNGKSGFFQDEKRPMPVPESIFDGCVAYKNREYGVWIRSYKEARIVNARVADNRAGFYIASEGFQWNIFAYLSNTDLFGVSRIRLQDSLVIGETNNVGQPQSCEELAVGRSLPQDVPFIDGTNLPRWNALTGVEFYDGLVGVERTTFAAFQRKNVASPLCIPTTYVREAGALAQVRYNDPWAVDPRNYVENLTFVNSGGTVTNEVWFRNPNGEFLVCNPPSLLVDDGAIPNTIIHDVDGSLTGVSGTSVFPNNAYLTPASGSIPNASWNANLTTSASGQVGPPSRPFAQFELIDLNTIVGFPASGVERIGLFRWTNSQWFIKDDPVLDACLPTQRRLDRYSTNLVTEDVHQIVYDPALTPAQWPSALFASVQFTEAGRWVYAIIPLVPPTLGQSLYVQVNTVPINAAASPTALYLGPGNEYFMDVPNNQLHVKIRELGTGTGIYSGERTTVFAIVL